MGTSPVWLWDAGTTQMLWANPAGAAIFDAASPGAVVALQFGGDHPAAQQIHRLAGTLPQGGAARLERLRGFGARLGGMLLCLCSRILVGNNQAAILVVATERAGRDLSLPERARRVLADIAPPAALFSADGELIESTAATKENFGAGLAALGAERLAREAILNGRAVGEIASGAMELIRLGAGTAPALLAVFKAPAEPSDPRANRDAAVPAAAMPVRAAADITARRHPFRFVWQMDANARFTAGGDDFAKVVGPKVAAMLNHRWHDLAAALSLDTDGRITRSLASRETWSGIVVQWPVDDAGERVAVEMSGLPMFDRDRQFEGYRGFGIIRDVDRLAELERRRAQTQSGGEPVADSPFADRSSAPVPEAGQPPAMPTEPQPQLTPVEQTAFQELARELNARLKKPIDRPSDSPTPDEFDIDPFSAPFAEPVASLAEPPVAVRPVEAAQDLTDARPILDRLPIGLLVYRLNNLIYANRAFLTWTGYSSLEALREAGGLDSLFIETKANPSDKDGSGGNSLTIATVDGEKKPVDGRLFSIAWHGENALVLMIDTRAAPGNGGNAPSIALRRLERENYELNAILDTATDGVLVLDRAGRVVSANRSAQALFGYDAGDLSEMSFGELFAPESRRVVVDYLDRQAHGESGTLDAGCEAIGRVRRGGLVPVFITIGRIEDGEKLCAVLRDITAWKRTEEELINARHDAERASTAKSEFLAKISHEIRTPLNAIIGFSEVMIEERFGAIGSERYRQYLKDIRTSGGHLISLLNDLLDLSKIEAGKLDLTFVTVNLNDLVQQSVAILQQEANRERVIIRSSLPANLPSIVADARSVRQIALNLLSNSIKFTGAGGQVIVSTALNDDNEVVLRVRDTGMGMSEKELETALEPFRQLATASRWGSSGTGLGLPITKALAEANHARFRITSQVADGTLVEIAFSATRVLAE
jgi:PAS domain S-box-containing protein